MASTSLVLLAWNLGPHTKAAPSFKATPSLNTTPSHNAAKANKRDLLYTKRDLLYNTTPSHNAAPAGTHGRPITQPLIGESLAERSVHSVAPPPIGWNQHAAQEWTVPSWKPAEFCTAMELAPLKLTWGHRSRQRFKSAPSAGTNGMRGIQDRLGGELRGA